MPNQTRRTTKPDQEISTAMTTQATTARGQIRIKGALGKRYSEILTPGAMDFLTALHENFAYRRLELLERRQSFQNAIDGGAMPQFLRETEAIRSDPAWQVASLAPGLTDRRVEITGPTDPKMTINALNSGAKVWLADFEDALSPTWPNVIEGQLSLKDAIRGRLEFTSPEGKHYAVKSGDIKDLPTIVVRPRGWHLLEKHLRYFAPSGFSQSVPGALVDFGLYFFHNAIELISRGRGPYFYLPKLQSHKEARLWNDIFNWAQDRLGVPVGTIRATVLIETLPAAFEMDEILYELRSHSSGLNAGRWDYMFSIIKTLRHKGKAYVLPDRAQITMTQPFMRAYTELLVKTCHRRGASAIGGMSAFIPNRRDPEVTAEAFRQVRADKLREAQDGFDGTWVAHPDLITVAQEEFDNVLGESPNQISRQRPDVTVSQGDLLDIDAARRAGASVTSGGLRTNISVGIRYLENWLRGNGAAAIDNLMEDVATAEISRSQVWQWIAAGASTASGAVITRDRVAALIREIADDLEKFPGNKYLQATDAFKALTLGDDFPAFLTIGAYSSYLIGSDADQPA
ncbi:MAG: malate synthase A [Bifidobacteriaceae bacterium]|jgi:malate synthase|nr:malate synthase A [Bifidobacteriaceae bacterium]